MKLHIISVEALLRNIRNIFNQQCSSYLVNFVLKLHSYAVKKNVPPNSKNMTRPQVPWTCESGGVTSGLLE